jgi:hypothetical protein
MIETATVKLKRYRLTMPIEEAAIMMMNEAFSGARRVGRWVHEGERAECCHTRRTEGREPTMESRQRVIQRFAEIWL